MERNEMCDMTKKEIINAKQCSKSLKDVVGSRICVEKIALVQTEKGEPLLLLFGEGQYYSTTSVNIISCADDIDDCITDEGRVTLEITSRKSKNDRDYLSFMIV